MIFANSHWCSTWSIWSNRPKGSARSIWWSWWSRLAWSNRPIWSQWFTWFTWSSWSPRSPWTKWSKSRVLIPDILNHVKVGLSEWMSALNFDFEKSKSRSLHNVHTYQVSPQLYNWDPNSLKRFLMVQLTTKHKYPTWLPLVCICCWRYPDSKVHEANMGPIWGRQDQGGPHAGPIHMSVMIICAGLLSCHVLTRYCNNFRHWWSKQWLSLWSMKSHRTKRL